LIAGRAQSFPYPEIDSARACFYFLPAKTHALPRMKIRGFLLSREAVEALKNRSGRFNALAL